MNLVFCLVVTLPLLHGGSACTCSPIDYAEQYCDEDNKIIAMVTILPNPGNLKHYGPWGSTPNSAKADGCVFFSTPGGESTTTMYTSFKLSYYNEYKSYLSSRM